MKVFFTEKEELSDEGYYIVTQKAREYDSLVEGIIKEGISQGIFKPLDSRMVVYAILGMINWMHQWYRPDGRLSWDEIAQIFSELVLKGILC